MGGHITAAAIEQYRDEYDGAMPICGVLGDHELFDFFLDYNLVAAALAGVEETTFPPDPDVWTTKSAPQITARSRCSQRWPAVLTPDGQHLKALTELRPVASARCSTRRGDRSCFWPVSLFVGVVPLPVWCSSTAPCLDRPESLWTTQMRSTSSTPTPH